MLNTFKKSIVSFIKKNKRVYVFFLSSGACRRGEFDLATSDTIGMTSVIA